MGLSGSICSRTLPCAPTGSKDLRWRVSTEVCSVSFGVFSLEFGHKVRPLNVKALAHLVHLGFRIKMVPFLF